MHREYHPDDIRHRHAHAFEADAREPGHAHDHSALFLLTTILGLLLGTDLALSASGLQRIGSPFGVSLALIAALLGGARIVYGALDALWHGRIGADLALAQACLAALVIGEPFVAAEVVFIALLGEVLEAVTADRAMRSIGRLFEQTPRWARVRREGQDQEVPLSQVVEGDLVIVGEGERIPIDGTILAGRSTVDQSALTGETLPVDKGPGDPVYTGSINQYGRIECRAERIGAESTYGQVLRLVAEAQHRKAPLQRTADRYAAFFLPIVETAAGLTLLAGYLLGWPDVWHRTVAVLVVACPCALVLATPAAIMASMAWLARHGVVIKGGIVLERLAKCDSVAFDKTGTLTLGRPELASVLPLADLDEDALLGLAASVESASPHPLAVALVQAARAKGLEFLPVADVQAQPGAGMTAQVTVQDSAPSNLLIGNLRLLREHGLEADPGLIQALDDRGETPLLIALDGRIVGALGLRDTVRPEAHDVIHDLKHMGFKTLALLTGDRAPAARLVAKKVHLKTVEAELLPADKALWVEQRQSEGRRVIMIGDGVNDAPALARADVGIAVGGPGADLAAEAGDVVILGDPLRNLPDLIHLSRATVSIIRQNIVIFAFGLNAVAIGSAMLGWLGPVPAAILHQVGSLLVLLNAMRLLVFGDWRQSSPVRRLHELGDRIHAIDDRLDLGEGWLWIARRRRGLAGVLAVVLVLGYGTSGVVSLGPEEVGLVRRAGRYVKTLPPGLHLLWPWPIETVDRLAPDRLFAVPIGFRLTDPARWESGHGRGTAAIDEEESLLLTGDGQLVELSAVVQIRLRNDEESLRRFAFGVADAPASVRPVAESVLRSLVGRASLSGLLSDRRRDMETEALERLRDRVRSYGLGLDVRSLAIQEVHPPLAVVQAFRDVSDAHLERDRRIHEAQRYMDEQAAITRGTSIALGEKARADRLGLIERARGEADGFLSQIRPRARWPALSDHDRFWTTMADLLADRRKVILDGPDSSRARRHLILPDPSIGIPKPFNLTPALLSGRPEGLP